MGRESSERRPGHEPVNPKSGKKPTGRQSENPVLRGNRVAQTGANLYQFTSLYEGRSPASCLAYAPQALGPPAQDCNATTANISTAEASIFLIFFMVIVRNCHVYIHDVPQKVSSKWQSTRSSRTGCGTTGIAIVFRGCVVRVFVGVTSRAGLSVCC